MTTPAIEVRSFQVTIPAGTTQTSPLVTSIAFPPRVVTAVKWRVPPGPSGLMGWQLTMSNGIAVIPTGGGFIIADDDGDTWPMTGLPDSGEWEVTGYNTDVYDHSVYIDFLLTLVTQTNSQVQLIATDEISNPSPSTVGPITTPALITVPAITTPGLVTVPAIITPQLITTAG